MRSRAIVCLVMVFLLCSATSIAVPSPGNSSPVPDKNSTPTGVPTYEGRELGDTVDDPFIIEHIPFHGLGGTCPFINDYDEACPYDGSQSPDVVYRYDCTYTFWATIDLCMSSYDTKVYVYENEYTQGYPIACNDDYAGCGPNGYRSWLELEFVYENTYYIVVDGYGDDCGNYELLVTDYLPCVWCPEDAFVESEPECIDPENDIDNGGCNSDPPVFDYLEPDDDDVYFCGTSGTYTQSGTNWRDTDWFQIELTHESELELTCIAEFPVRIGFIDGREGCENVSSFYSYADGYPCGIVELTETLGAGTWWVWVGPVGFEDVYCGAEYMCGLTGYTPVTPVENSSWSTIKALYR